MKGGKSKADTKNGDGRLAVKRGAPKKAKPAKDPNKPKRPPSAFFVFMEDFRGEYKQLHPQNKSVATVCKAGGEKWKIMSDAEKAPYIQKAEKRKADYEVTMTSYNRKLSQGQSTQKEEQEDGSDKSKSEVHDEDEGDSGEEDEDDD